MTTTPRVFKRREDVKGTSKSRIKLRRGSNHVEIAYFKGSMTVQGEVYRKRVNVPKPSDLINISAQDLSRILRLPDVKSEDIKLHDSIFTAYAVPVTTHQQIRDYYVKYKLIQPNARHIVCAYLLQGEPEYYNADYCDDEEHGAGRNLLELLKTPRTGQLCCVCCKEIWWS